MIVDFGRALGQMGDPRFSRVLLQAVLVTLAGLALVFWVAMLSLGWLLPETVTLPWIGTVGFVDNLVSWAAVGVMLALSVVLMVPVAAGVVGFFLDEVAAAVEARHYPNLPPLFALGLSQQVADSLRFMALVIAVNIGALLVYVIAPPLAPVVFVLVNGFLLGREYFQLVAMRRLGPEGARALARRHFWRLWLGGTLMAAPLTVPLLNLVIPILGVAVFTHQYHRLAPS
ncbi:EI24 domain-containing protein [uncultured Amaricoccus sp.]|uniref:EI24 domain-containing protein n=1 Tax=uncultured Amaricoccus sp. TaxID=339341 RepID=UPI002638C2F9|nr:EI24 domain-containing protein [uncultured Amaricoccus sp.]